MILNGLSALLRTNCLRSSPENWWTGSF